MKKILFLFLLLPLFGISQTWQTPLLEGKRENRMGFDSVAQLPIGLTGGNNGLRTKLTYPPKNHGYDTAQVRYNIADSSIRVWTGWQWLSVGGGGGAGYGRFGVEDLRATGDRTFYGNDNTYAFTYDSLNTFAVRRDGFNRILMNGGATYLYSPDETANILISDAFNSLMTANETNYLKQNSDSMWTPKRISYASNINGSLTANSLITKGMVDSLNLLKLNISDNFDGGTNPSGYLQYTDVGDLARVSVALTTTGTSGVATYNNVTGIFNIPNYTSSFPSGQTLQQVINLGNTIVSGANQNTVSASAINMTDATNTGYLSPVTMYVTNGSEAVALLPSAVSFGTNGFLELLKAQAALSANRDIYLPNGNVIDTLATLDNLRDAGVGGGSPAGSSTWVQYNNGGAFGAEANLNYDISEDRLNSLKVGTRQLEINLPAAPADSTKWLAFISLTTNNLNIASYDDSYIPHKINVEFRRDGLTKFNYPAYYNINYGSSFTARSLVDKNYVDSSITAGGGFTAEDAQDAVGAMVDTDQFTYTDGTPLLAIKTQMSITDDASGLKLVADETTPSDGKFYGKLSGSKGWFNPISLTTTGSSGASTYNTSTNVLNIPNYGSSGLTWNGIYAIASEAITNTSYTMLNTTVFSVFTGSSDGTWTLPALSGNLGKNLFVKNGTTHNLIIQRAGSDVIYNDASVNSITLAGGESVALYPASTTWYTYFDGKPSAGGSYVTENAQDDIGTILDTDQFTYNDGTPSIAIKTQMSIVDDASGLKLSGDENTPTDGKFYGKSGGVKGWYIPSGTTWAGVFSGVNTQSGSLTLAGTWQAYLFDGGSPTTWTIPALSGNNGRAFFVKNGGSATLTLQRTGSDNLYTTTTVTTYDLAPGEHCMIWSNAVLWIVHQMPTGGSGITQEQSEDYTGAMFATDNGDIDATYNDGTPDIELQIKAGAIVNADINASAAIAYSKLNLTGAILNADLAGSIAISKLSITGTPDGTKFLRDDGSWQNVTSFAFGNNMITATAVGTDANITAVAGTAYYLPAATLSTGRTINVAGLVSNGDYLEFYNSEEGFVWSFTGATVYDSDGVTAITELLANTNSVIRRVNGKLMISKL